MAPRPCDVSRAAFESMFRTVCNGRRFGSPFARGTLAFATPQTLCAVADLVPTGRVVSLAAPLRTAAAPDTPRPARHARWKPSMCAARRADLTLPLTTSPLRVPRATGSRVNPLAEEAMRVQLWR